MRRVALISLLHEVKTLIGREEALNQVVVMEAELAVIKHKYGKIAHLTSAINSDIFPLV